VIRLVQFHISAVARASALPVPRCGCDVSSPVSVFLAFRCVSILSRPAMSVALPQYLLAFVVSIH
jgi:hypothetical protein